MSQVSLITDNLLFTPLNVTIHDRLKSTLIEENRKTEINTFLNDYLFLSKEQKAKKDRIAFAKEEREKFIANITNAEDTTFVPPVERKWTMLDQLAQDLERERDEWEFKIQKFLILVNDKENKHIIEWYKLWRGYDQGWVKAQNYSEPFHPAVNYWEVDFFKHQHQVQYELNLAQKAIKFRRDELPFNDIPKIYKNLFIEDYIFPYLRKKFKLI